MVHLLRSEYSKNVRNGLPKSVRHDRVLVLIVNQVSKLPHSLGNTCVAKLASGKQILLVAELPFINAHVVRILWRWGAVGFMGFPTMHSTCHAFPKPEVPCIKGLSHCLVSQAIYR